MQRRMFSASAAVGIGLALALLTASPSQSAPVASGRASATPPAQQCRTIDFTKASVTPIASTDPASPSTQYRLTVTGSATSSNVSVKLTPLVYIQQPDYWGIQVIGCSPGVGLPVIRPYTATYDFTGALGKCGIEVVGATRQQRIDLARCGSVPLPGTSWVLDPASLGVPVPDGAAITAKFSTATMSGYTSCNSYQGDYTAGDDGTFTLGRLRATLRICDQVTSRAESAFLDKLTSADQYQATADELSLLVGGEQALRFVPAKAS